MILITGGAFEDLLRAVNIYLAWNSFSLVENATELLCDLLLDLADPANEEEVFLVCVLPDLLTFSLVENATELLCDSLLDLADPANEEEVFLVCVLLDLFTPFYLKTKY